MGDSVGGEGLVVFGVGTRDSCCKDVEFRDFIRV